MMLLIKKLPYSCNIIEIDFKKKKISVWNSPKYKQDTALCPEVSENLCRKHVRTLFKNIDFDLAKTSLTCTLEDILGAFT